MEQRRQLGQVIGWLRRYQGNGLASLPTGLPPEAKSAKGMVTPAGKGQSVRPQVLQHGPPWPCQHLHTGRAPSTRKLQGPAC